MDIAGVWIRRSVYLLVTVVVLAAPLLGVIAVPKFSPLVSAFPESLRTFLTVLVSVLFGVVAIFARLFAENRWSIGTRRILGLCCLVFVVLLVIIIAYHLTSWIVRVDYNRDANTAEFIVGGNGRLVTCKCDSSVSDAECIEGLSFSYAKVAACWGDKQINQAKFFLTLEYIGTLFFLVLSVAFLVLLEGGKPRPEERDTR